MNIFSNIKKRLFPDPEVGQTYVHCTDANNPFDRLEIRIVDIKNGWIQYEYVGGNGRRFSETISDLRRYWTLCE